MFILYLVKQLGDATSEVLRDVINLAFAGAWDVPGCDIRRFRRLAP
jgi:hypothetical protein